MGLARWLRFRRRLPRLAVPWGLLKSAACLPAAHPAAVKVTVEFGRAVDPPGCAQATSPRRSSHHGAARLRALCDERR